MTEKQYRRRGTAVQVRTLSEWANHGLARAWSAWRTVEKFATKGQADTALRRMQREAA